jgi:transcriptional regulator with XRE-family HTH domain
VDRERLADRVRTRRLRLGLSVSKAARDAGISRTTWISIEEASRDTHAHTYRAIERVLEWPEGAIEAILAGGEPVQATEPARPPRREVAGEVAIRQIEVVLDHRGLDPEMALNTIRGIVFNYRRAVAQPEGEAEQRLAAG